MNKKIDDMTEAELDAELLKASKGKKVEDMSEDELDKELSKYTSSLGTPENGSDELGVLAELANNIGTMLDYPIAPIRAALNANIESIKSLGKNYPTEKIVDSIVDGPSNAPTPAEVAANAGVPTEPVIKAPIVGEFTPASIAGVGLDALMSAQVGRGAKNLMRDAGNAIVKPQDQVVKAINLPAKTLKEGLYASPKSTKNLKNIVDYADKNIITPMGSTEKYFDKVMARSQALGKQMQSIYQGTRSALESWLSSPNTDPKLVQEYLDGGFNAKSAIPRMSQAVDDLKMSESDKSKVLQHIIQEVEPDLKKHSRLDAVKLAELDSYWSKKANNMMKDKPDTVAEAAYGVLRDEAERAKQFELEFGRKHFLTEKSYQDLKKIDAEYSMIKKIEKGLADKRASEMKAPIELTKIKSTRVNSLLSQMPIDKGASATEAAITGGAYLRAPRNISEPFLEGFPMSKTLQVTPEEAMVFTNEIRNNPEYDSIERAKRINLLQKHGRVYMGQ